VRALSLASVAILAIATPALAQEQALAVDVRATRLDEAVRALGNQSGISIGFRDPRFAALRVRAVRGRLTAGQALDRLLRGTVLQARRVAPATYLIEARPARARLLPLPRASVAGSRAAAPLAPPVEIVVTGSKRAIPIGAYPGGIQIIDGDKLSVADGARGTGAIEARVASVVSTHLGPGRNKLFIRGIADSSFVGPTQATVGQYWGNSRVTYSAPDPSLRLYDVKRIEVLEGPQGTLYGAGSLGGVVRVVPQAPDPRALQARAWAGTQAVQHGEPGVDGGAVINLPIAEDRLALRAVAYASYEGGYIDDVGRKLTDVNKVQTYGGRAALRFLPGDDWTVDLSLVGQRIDGDDSQYADRGIGDLSRASTVAQPYRNDFYLVDLVLRKQWDSLEFTTSLGYAYQQVSERFEGAELADARDSSIAPTFDAAPALFSQRNRIDMVTLEARLARHGAGGTGWLIGASLLHNAARTNRRMDAVMFGSPLTGVRNRVEEATLYGEGTAALAERLTLTLGGRLTHARLSGRSEDAFALLDLDAATRAAMALALDPTASTARAESRFLPSAAIAYRPSDTVTLFARYQQGIRPGGIAVRREYIQRFKGDRVSTMEAGLRYRSAALEVEASTSWTDWRNIQADLIDGFGFPATDNVGDGRVFSIGMAARWRPVRGLEFDAAAYLNDSKVTERFAILTGPGGATAPAFGSADFKRLPNIADVTGRAGFAYGTRLTDRLDFTTNGFVRYVGQSTLGIGPILGKLQGDYVDTGLTIRIGDGRRAATLDVTNLLDSKGNRFALGSPFLVRDKNQITPLQPRTVRVGFEYSF